LVVLLGLLVLLALSAMSPPPAAAQAAAQATAQPAAKPAPSIDEILERSIRATGGREAWKKLTSLRAKGAAEISGADVTGAFEFLAKAPNKSAQTITLSTPGGAIVVRQGFDGQQGWKDLPGQGLQDLSGEELSQTKRDAEFYGELKFRELYPHITYLGEEDVNDRGAYVIRAATADGAARKMYFDKQSGLRVRMDDEKGVGGNPPSQSYFDDYKEVPGTGVKLPSTMRVVTPMATVVLHVEEFAPNAVIDDALFAKPAAADATGGPSPNDKAPQ